MTRRFPALVASVLLALMAGLVACGSPAENKAESTAEVPAAPVKLVHPKQEDLSRYMPRENRVSASLTQHNLFGKETLPQATLAEYKKGARTYQQFLFKTQNAGMAAVYLGYLKDEMTAAKFVAGFGGYFGEIDGKPVFVFVKGEYVTGLVGLPLKQADAEGRLIAVRIP